MAVCDKLIATLAQTDPWLVEAYYNRGRVYSMKGQFDLAIADFTQAIALAPPAPGAVNYRGAVYLDEGNYDLAVRRLPDRVGRQTELGASSREPWPCLFHEKQLGARARRGERSTPARSQLVWAKTVRLRINSARKQFAEVISDATAMIAVSPTNGEAFYIAARPR